VKEKPQLIVCDIMMPELDGYGVLHLLKSNPETERIPFIFLTAKTERVDFRKGMEMGADDYVTKPFDDLELLRAIEIRLKRIDIIQAQYAPGEKGANDFMKSLEGSGIRLLDPEQYDSDILPKKGVLYYEGKRPKFLHYLKKGKIKTYKTQEDG